MSALFRLFHTLKPLRWLQWWYRAWHPLRKSLSKPAGAARSIKTILLPSLQAWPVATHYDPRTLTFVFLNRKRSFGDMIDWEYAAEGPLWKFNLHYFEWLYDEQLSIVDRLETVSAFCRATTPGKSMHGYPTSLRIMAWIWFDLKHDAFTDAARRRLFQDADWLRRFPEYQLDGNHLFENAIALTTAGFYFENDRMLAAGKALLEKCVREQIYNDGGHCEGSPMYHSLLLWRLMQAMEICAGRPAPEDLQMLLSGTIAKMLGWLKAMTFSDGTWPAVNDAVAGIAPAPSVLFKAAAALGIASPKTQLGDCGYRMIRTPDYELFIDVDGIRPSWQPGHAHADTGNFCLHVRGQAVIVDTGCSTYEDPAIRMVQRGTGAHNTIRINGRDSSQMWSRFRVGRRCKILKLQERTGGIYIEYEDASRNHLSREFSWNEKGIAIRDKRLAGALQFNNTLHITPGFRLEGARIGNLVELDFSGFNSQTIKSTEIAGGFNVLLSSACLLLSGAEHESVIHVRLIPK
jgi:hypothetical protein